MQNLQIWRQVRRIFGVGVMLGLSLFLLPLLMVLAGNGEDIPVLPAEPTPVITPTPTPAAGGWDSTQTLRILLEDGTVEEMGLDDYLWRVVAAEMPAAFEPEALKAQSACARTYTLWKMAAGSHSADEADICADSACCQAYITPREAAEKWEAQADAYTAKITEAVRDTDGQVLTYGGSLIQAVFFSSSTAATEDAAAVWGNSLPYLVSVDSPEGEEVPNYRSTVTLTAEEVRTLAEEAGLAADLTGNPGGWIGGIRYTASGRVDSLTLGGVTLSGGAARALFSLRSTCFTVEEAEGVFTFSVTGYGHGVGMSQYGANAMAKEGSGWQEIVTHYYTGVTVEAASAMKK